MKKYKIRKGVKIEKRIQFGFDINFMWGNDKWNDYYSTIFMVGVGFLCFSVYFCIDKKVFTK